MRSAISAFALTLTGFFAGAVFFIAASLVLAWTGPTSAPPNGNVSAPINVGATDQIKNAGLGINSLAVFGNSILSGPSVTYLNFGTIPEGQPPSSGYGIRDNNGTMEFKNSSGSWQSPLSASSTFSQIKFADGTTQTTAPGTGGIAAVTTASCTSSCFSPGCTGSCVATCPATYSRTGCSSSKGDAQPSGSAGCTCTSGFGGPNANTCYSFCAK